MIFLFVGLSIISAGILCLILTKRQPFLTGVAFLSCLTAGCAAVFMGAVEILLRNESLVCRVNWKLPWGEFYIGLDPLSALFLLAITILCFLAGVYGFTYQQNNENNKGLSGHYSFYLVLLISLMLVVTARNAILFLFAWEAMSVSSYFLITYDDDKEEVRKAGLLYLIATHTGTFCLWVMFILLGIHTGSMNFDQMATAQFPLVLAGIIFVLGIVGFGVKAGFIPFHIWLPHAHPAAPSYISAVLSGVMIKMGIYGILRMIMIVKHFPDWCSIILLLIGIISGVGGVLYALGQHEIKKLLAYHSIENIGIIALGLGIGLWGQTHHYMTIALIGYTGGVLHVFNHAIFKGLLFLSAGSVIRRTHTGDIDLLGGLFKLLPWTSSLFLAGSLAICGLPLFNGFISEWFIFRGLFGGVFSFHLESVIFIGAAIIALALIGGLALMCFTKAFGTVFLGQGRSLYASDIKENPKGMIVPMLFLAMICVWIGILPQTMVSICLQCSSEILRSSSPDIKGILGPLQWIVLSLVMLIGISAGLVLLRSVATRSLPKERSETWGCGYVKAEARMQYTASSFAVPILRLFRDVLCLRSKGSTPKQVFSESVHLSSEVIDSSEHFLFRRIFDFIQRISIRSKIIQCGYTQMYVLYIFIFLFFILIWKVT